MFFDYLSIVVLQKLLPREEEHFLRLGWTIIIPSDLGLFESADIISNLQKLVIFLISCTEIHSVPE